MQLKEWLQLNKDGGIIVVEGFSPLAAQGVEEEVQKATKSSEVIIFRGQEECSKSVVSELCSASFFGKNLLVLRDADKLASSEKAYLKEHLLKTPCENFLCLVGAKGIGRDFALKSALHLVQPEEKIWDKQKRIKLELAKKSQKKGVVLASSVIEKLVEVLALDELALENEFQKLLLLAEAERREITLSDLSLVAPYLHSASTWQLMDAVLIKDLRLALFLLDKLDPDEGQLIMLFKQLRSQVWGDLQLLNLRKEGKTFTEIQASMGNIKESHLEKRAVRASKWGIGGLERLLIQVQQYELKQRFLSLAPKVIFEGFLHGVISVA